MRGQEILLGITEIDAKNSILKLSQQLYTKRNAEFHVDSEYSGFIVSIRPTCITVGLRGMRGILYPKQNIPGQRKIIDLTTLLRLGQEITVVITKKHNDRVAVVSLREDMLLSLIEN